MTAQIRFVTRLPGIQHLAAPIPGSRVKPEWFQKAPVDVAVRGDVPLRGMKACPGITDYLAMGYVIPAWADMIIDRRVDEEGDSYSLRASLPPEEMTSGLFTAEMGQMPTESTESRYYMKIECPWLIVTPPGWSVLLLPLAYHRGQALEIPPGVVDTDVMHQVHLLARLRFEGRHFIELGQPLLHVIPFRREPLEHELEYDPEEWQNLHAAGKGAPGKDGDRIVPNAYRRWRRQFREEHGLD